MTMRPCVPQTSSSRPGGTCLHFVHPESEEDTNTWDQLNVSYADFTDQIAEVMGLDPENYSFATLTNMLDRSAIALDRHVVDLMYELGDDEEDPDPATLRAIRQLHQPPAPSSPVGSPDDLDVINRHRRDLGMDPIDPAGGWTEGEIQEMAEHIRTTGRMSNPLGDLKRRLLP